MDGQGHFKHGSGKVLIGTFRQNLYQHDTCFLDPLQGEKGNKRTEERLLKELYIDPTRNEIL